MYEYQVTPVLAPSAVAFCTSVVPGIGKRFWKTTPARARARGQGGRRAGIARTPAESAWVEGYGRVGFGLRLHAAEHFALSDAGPASVQCTPDAVRQAPAFYELHNACTAASCQLAGLRAAARQLCMPTWAWAPCSTASRCGQLQGRESRCCQSRPADMTYQVVA